MRDPRNIPYYKPNNFYLEDPFFQKLMKYYLPEEELSWAEEYLQKMGELSAQKISPLVLESDQHPPELIQFDPTGKRIDRIDYHHTYKDIAKLVYEFGILGLGHSPEFQSQGRCYSPLLKFGIGYLFSQAGSVLYCPICMTDGTLQILKHHGSEELKSKWIPRLTDMIYSQFNDGGMYLTEAQGGSDVGANTCIAYQEEGNWKLKGEKWFCSNVGSDTALVLARPEGAPEGTRGLGLFFFPFYLENGEPNGVLINRFKPKLGTREMPTGEIELNGAVAYLVGDLQKGFAYMTEMLNLSRAYNSIWAIGLMQRSYLEAQYYAEHREAFGKPIIQHPLVAQTLKTMKEDAEKANCLVFETLQYMDRIERGSKDPKDLAMIRLLTPVIKFYTAEKCIEATHRAIEILGGNGCMEDFPLPKMMRDAQILAIWEGTANILSLDLLRVMKKTGAHEIFLELTQRQIETQLKPEQRGEFPGRWENLKGKFTRVLSGEDGFGGELECRELALQVAKFLEELVWTQRRLEN